MKLADIKKGYAAMNAGAWVSGIPQFLFDGERLKVRRLWNPDYVALHDRLSEEKTDLSEAANESRITDACLAETVLIDWELEDPFSAEAVAIALADPVTGGPLRSAILWAATHLGDQVKADLKADAKN